MLLGESTLSSLRGSSSTIDCWRSGTVPEPRAYSIEGSVPRNVNVNYREPNALPSRGKLGLELTFCDFTVFLHPELLPPFYLSGFPTCG